MKGSMRDAGRTVDDQLDRAGNAVDDGLHRARQVCCGSFLHIYNVEEFRSVIA